MSRQFPNSRAQHMRRRDEGMTLIELILAVVMLGLISVVISSAIIVTLRQHDNTDGRLNVARSEQSVSLWIPADLSSATVVDTSPEATPCGASVCDGIDLSAGSNVLMMTWTTGSGTNAVDTAVSYNFAPSSGGESYDLTRVECVSNGTGWTCKSLVVLSQLPGPPGGAEFVPGVANGAACSLEADPVPCTRPDWVIIVSQPLAPDAVDGETIANESDRKDANRVIVSINGGGDVDGAGGGVNQISITAGGTIRTEIEADSVLGAPSFVEARSRCGGPMALVIDESGSIDKALNNVKAGVRDFITALAGTPVMLEMVRFETESSILGSGDWHHYFDMTNQADVDAALAAALNLTTGGSTNWEDALFRTFYDADGSIAAQIPETVVLFTDGVPTMDRLLHRASPGVLPGEPLPPVEPWPESSGFYYSQVGFNRADFIANQFRRSVRLIGVGVGSGIENDSTWIVDPGAGYRWVTERGSYSHVHETLEFQLRYQKKNSWFGSYYWVDKPTYDAAKWYRRKDVGWNAVPESVYDSINITPGDGGSDGAREIMASQPVSTVEYDANVGDPAYQPVAKTWNAGPDWEVWTGSQSGPSSHYRTAKIYNTPPYDGFEPAVTAETENSIILARLIAGNDFGTRAIPEGDSYSNAEIADLYIEPDWDRFSVAMKAVALGECGGTVTLQTKVNGSTPAPDPFRYENSAVLDSDGLELDVEPTVVTTSQLFVTGTFDFNIPNGDDVTAEIIPQNFSELTSYSPNSWSCKAGNQSRSFTLVDIDGESNWKGIQVDVAANEAVSCTLSVSEL